MLATESRIRVADLYIAGEWLPASSGRRFVVSNPATREVIAEVADGGREEARAAVAAAHAAFPAWSQTPAAERARLLHRAADLIDARRDELAEIVTSENGKPLAESASELAGATEFLRWNADEGRRIVGHVLPLAGEGHRLLTFRQPVGVVAAIVPWNFPAGMVTRKIAPALAAGCTVVLKPAPQTPLIAVELFHLFHEAGFPAGVVNLVTGTDAAAIGDEFLSSPLVRKLTFTGSTAVGKRLLARAADTVKRVSLELGGHAPFIVFADADLDRAAAAAASSGFRNGGQVCVSTNRVLVERAVAEEFAARLAEKARALRVGDGLAPDTDVGPLIDERGFAKVASHVEDARARGARVLAGGRRAEVAPHLRGFFYEPTVLGSVPHDAVVMHEETFGPVLPVATFDTEDEAVRIANDTPYGLAAYFFTRDLGRIFRLAERLEYGIVGANDARPFGSNVPFGGMKESGLGRENGFEGVAEFLETKAVAIGF